MSRPRGEIRQALVAAAQQGPGTWREFAERAQVGYDIARRTVEKMACTGELARVGQAKLAHSNHWVRVYELADCDDEQPQPWGGAEALASVLFVWGGRG